ncbi:MAG: HAD-IIIA family hydrolase [Endozoicomonadaceae bacterium]|nr:HAD-IIIA family hydrolase [Endozoicomonadaceae bacterium]
MTDTNLTERACMIKLAAFDVDGVMTDGTIYYNDQGSELKAFNILDGMGIKLLQKSGVKIAIITGRSSDVVSKRAKELNVDFLMQGREDKLVALTEIVKSLELSLKEVAYLGDDLPDLPAICAAGLGMTVPNGSGFVKKKADGVTKSSGGKGAVREFCELIMHAQGTLSQQLAEYL